MKKVATNILANSCLEQELNPCGYYGHGILVHLPKVVLFYGVHNMQIF